MVRTLTFILGGVLLVHGAAFAAGNPDTGPGCGLGKLAWMDYKNQKDIAPQVLMATTNGTFGSTTFGISTGTSGCTSSGKVMSEHKATMFASLNFENLSQEMAQGEGEHLASLATLLNIPPEHQAEFFALTKERYNSLIESGETTSMAMLKALNETIAGHPVLAKVSANR
jgi:Protein of unknown function (DUF3015)